MSQPTIVNYLPFVQRAKLYNSPVTATPLNICKAPREGAKVVPFVVTLNSTTPSVLIDLTIGSANPPISQVAAIFADCTQCSDDIVILFPDTNYVTVIPRGTQMCVPVLTGSALPKFYVISTQAITTSIANIYVLNQFIPELANVRYTKAIVSGYEEDDIDLISIPIQYKVEAHQVFSFPENLNIGIGVTHIRAIQARVIIESSVNQTYLITLTDNIVGASSTLYFFLEGTPTRRDFDLINMYNLDMRGAIRLATIDTTANLVYFRMSINVIYADLLRNQ